MYLSLLRINTLDRKAIHTLTDVYRLHEFVMSGFARYDPAGRVLFRVEPETNDQKKTILVQSDFKPSWSSGTDKTTSFFSVQCKSITPSFQNGRRYRFRLRVNPTVTRNGKRYGLVGEEAIINWLQKRIPRIGAKFPSLSIIDEGYLRGRKAKKGSQHQINIKVARFDGILEIVDFELFNNTFRNGIGAAKAFGCGMLSLAK